MRAPRRLAGLLTLTLASGCVNGVFYQPDSLVYQTPADRHLDYEDVSFRSLDGTPLSAWFVPAVGTARGTVIQFHGNAQNMTAHFSFLDWLPSAGYNLFVFDYRGYGKSGGRPGRRGVYEDSVAALRTVAARPDVDPQRLIVVAQSLGVANAVTALARNRFPGVRAIVLDSGFASYRAITRDKIALIPVVSLLRWPLACAIVSNGFSPDRDMPDLPPVPLLILHGTDDPIIPYRHSQLLYARANPPKTLWTVEGGRHTEALSRYRSRYAQALLEFFDAALAENPVAR